MIVVSDSTPIISLVKIGMLDLLKRFYGEVILPDAVFYEVCGNPIFEAESAVIKSCGFIKTKAAENTQAIKILRSSGLDLGESEAIVLADTLQDALLLMDERKGRQIAQNMGIRTVGTLGILLRAKEIEIVKQIKPLLDMMINENIRIGASLYRSILEKAGELQPALPLQRGL
ncbi:MAG: DUF3368 domain-containing protein [Oscillospiraceae bacterium]|jgi:predicted nucleic acid-binding protein|nr:DUF3368 domain-containing protein [Oscillospiraceae bacterium]